MSSLEGRKVKKEMTWRVVYYWQGRKEHVKIGITTRRTALQKKAQIDSLIAMDKNPRKAVKHNSGISLSALRELDIEWCSSRKRPRTVKINTWCVNRLINWTGEKRIDEIDRKLIENYLNYLRDELGCNETTRNMQLRTLKAIFQRAIDEHELLSEHPFRTVKPHSSERTTDKPKFLTIDQIEILLENIDNLHFKRLVQFYLLTGCRRTEAVELKWNEIDKQTGIFYLGQPDSQTKLRRAFPLTEEIEHLFSDLKEDRDRGELVFPRFSKNPAAISKKFQTLRERVEKLPPELTTHLLRHTFASHLVMQGVDLTTVSSLLGHSTVKVTELYAHLQPDHIRMAVERLPYKIWG
jgi:integrase